MGRWRVIGIVAVGLLVGFTGMLSVQRAAHTAPSAPEFTLVNVETNGVKVWLPSVIVVHPGEKVTLKLQNKLDAPHGFAVDDYGIQVVVPASGIADPEADEDEPSSRPLLSGGAERQGHEFLAGVELHDRGHRGGDDL